MAWPHHHKLVVGVESEQNKIVRYFVWTLLPTRFEAWALHTARITLLLVTGSEPMDHGHAGTGSGTSKYL